MSVKRADQAPSVPVGVDTSRLPFGIGEMGRSVDKKGNRQVRLTRYGMEVKVIRCISQVYVQACKQVFALEQTQAIKGESAMSVSV